MADENLMSAVYLDSHAGFTPDSQRDAGLTRWQLDSDDIIDSLEHDLRGDILKIDQESGQEYWSHDPKHEPFLNDVGIKAVVNIIKPIVNKNTFLTNFSEERVNDLLFYISNKITRTLYINYEVFEIKPEFFPILNEMIQTFLESALRRPQDQGERKFLSSTEQRRILIQEGQQHKRFGLFGGGKQ